MRFNKEGWRVTKTDTNTTKSQKGEKKDKDATKGVKQADVSTPTSPTTSIGRGELGGEFGTTSTFQTSTLSNKNARGRREGERRPNSYEPNAPPS